MILLAALPASAQPTLPARMFEVPPEGYSGTDTYNNTDMWNEYRIQVPQGYELEYDFRTVGPGNFTIYLLPHIGAEYLLQGGYYISFSSPEPVESFSRTFPADFGFAHEYTIAINSTANISYSASIHINQVHRDYTVHYILIALGGIFIVSFSWVAVNRQVRKERETELAARKRRKERSGKRRR